MNNVVFAGGIVLALAATGWAYKSLHTSSVQRPYVELFVEAQQHDPDGFRERLEQATLVCGNLGMRGSSGDPELIRTKAVQVASKIISKIASTKVDQMHGKNVGKSEIQEWITDTFYGPLKSMGEPGTEILERVSQMIGTHKAVMCVITQSVDSFYGSSSRKS